MNAETLGQKLTEAREAKFVDISRAAADTKIMVQIITDLENDCFDRIAAPIYARGFIRSYCSYLGIDPAPLIAEYDNKHNAKIEKRHSVKSTVIDVNSEDKLKAIVDTAQVFFKKFEDKNPVFYIICGGVVVILLAIILLFSGSKKESASINISSDQQVDQLIGEPKDVYLTKPGNLEAK